MKKILLLISLLSILKFGICQSLNIDNVGGATKNSFQPIIEQGIVKGYFLIFFLDQYTETGNLLDLKIYDLNLKQTHSIELIRNKDEQLIDGVFNGEKFCFAFYNIKSKYIDYLILDKKGEVSGSYVVNELTDLEIQYLVICAASKNDNYFGLLAPVEKKGFLRYGIKAKKGDMFGIQKDMRIQLEVFSNEGEVLWTKGTELIGKKIWESADHLFSNEKYIVTSILFRNGLMATNCKNYLLCSSAETGKELYSLEINKENTFLSYTGINYDEISGDFFCYGEYYDGEINYKNKSLGLFIKTINASNGEVKKECFISWKKDINPFLQKKGISKEVLGRNINIHKILRTDDGKIFAITEQFGKNDTTNSLFLYDLITFEFSNELSILNADIINKASDTYFNSKYSGGSRENLTVRGNFDYFLTSVSINKKNFTSVYKIQENNKYYIGSFTYKDQHFSYDKILRTGNPIIFNILPGKVGYITIFEYYDKEKRIAIRHEKLNI